MLEEGVGNLRSFDRGNDIRVGIWKMSGSFFGGGGVFYMKGYISKGL